MVNPGRILCLRGQGDASGGHRTWFSVVLVLIAVIILIWMFFPF